MTRAKFPLLSALEVPCSKPLYIWTDIQSFFMKALPENCNIFPAALPFEIFHEGIRIQRTPGFDSQLREQAQCLTRFLLLASSLANWRKGRKKKCSKQLGQYRGTNRALVSGSENVAQNTIRVVLIEWKSGFLATNLVPLQTSIAKHWGFDGQLPEQSQCLTNYCLGLPMQTEEKEEKRNIRNSWVDTEEWTER